MRTIRFPGQYYDTETGLHYNRFRYYDPSIGRYVSADPIGQAGGVNVYGYAGNDPTNQYDRYGLFGVNLDPGLSIPLFPDVPGPSSPNPALQKAAKSASCAAGRVGREALATGLGLGFLGSASAGATITIAGALSFGAAATIAAGTGAYLTALGTTTIINSINSTFGTDLATFSNTGPAQKLFPDFTSTGLGPFESSGCGCEGQ